MHRRGLSTARGEQSTAQWNQRWNVASNNVSLWSESPPNTQCGQCVFVFVCLDGCSETKIIYLVIHFTQKIPANSLTTERISMGEVGLNYHCMFSGFYIYFSLHVKRRSETVKTTGTTEVIFFVSVIT